MKKQDQKLQSQIGELSDDDLDAVAGGVTLQQFSRQVFTLPSFSPIAPMPVIGGAGGINPLAGCGAGTDDTGVMGCPG